MVYYIWLVGGPPFRFSKMEDLNGGSLCYFLYLELYSLALRAVAFYEREQFQTTACYELITFC